MNSEDDIANSDLPTKIKRALAKRRITTFAEGEGHHEHVGVPDAVKLFCFEGRTYARFTKATQIKHVRKGSLDGGEHNALEVLAPGDYEYGQVLEYDYLSRMARKVVD